MPGLSGRAWIRGKIMNIVTAGIGAACISILLASSALAGAPKGAVATAEEAPKGAGEEPAPSAKAPEDDRAGCRTVRRRLWLEREGWVVRKVTFCY